MIVSWFFIFILRITIVLYCVVLYNHKIGKLIIAKQQYEYRKGKHLG